MPMPNDNDKNLSPDEEPEEKKYSFLQETIKPKPISRRQLAKAVDQDRRVWHDPRSVCLPWFFCA